MWRETFPKIFRFLQCFISIHSLRVEGDLPACLQNAVFAISIHSLRVEGDVVKYNTMMDDGISIHSLRVEGDLRWMLSRLWRTISIHSLRVEGDNMRPIHITLPFDFNPLPPCGGRRRHVGQFAANHCISIHSLRVEGDRDEIISPRDEIDFNPLPPCGGRPMYRQSAAQRTQFQSTPSVWRETKHALGDDDNVGISIHSLRVEGDPGAGV